MPDLLEIFGYFTADTKGRGIRKSEFREFFFKTNKFFQKLINESRRARTGAPAKPSKKPAIGGPPRFISRHVGPAMGTQQTGAQQTGAQQMGGGRG